MLMTLTGVHDRLRVLVVDGTAAGLLKDLDAVIGTVADVDQTVIAEDDAMRVAAAGGAKSAGAQLSLSSRRPAPLTDILPGRVEDDDAVVAVAVCDINVPLCGYG